ncbi:hypothetical protein CCAX7_30150 [Capsulimonas corticalis]|uniref:Uncharacterized protein n=1 Tax=Capsulimonas corticalis TaxID=2219043 RepID=A0A402CST4_9BACT|nr:right-handed parallel beta-helix repeat-containing protein [Capsulimonas corticalis]BDI30964.1 hypothetical protein CCAX7_30150 [Capsulimonas corticalis]
MTRFSMSSFLSSFARFAVLVLLFAALASPKPGRAQSYPTVGSPSNPAGLQAAIQSAYNSGAAGVTIAPGTYNLPVPSSWYLDFDNMQNFVISAYGVTLVMADEAWSAIHFGNCRNVSLQGAYITMARPSFTQGAIVAANVDATGPYYDVQLDAGYPRDFTSAAHWLLPGYLGDGNLFDKNTRKWKTGINDVGVTSVSQLNGSGLYRFRINDSWAVPGHGGPVVLGDFIAIKGRTGQSIVQDNCTVTLRDLTLAWVGGAHEYGAGPNYYENLYCTYQPAPSGGTVKGLLGYNGVNSINTRFGPIVENCTWEGAPDDVFNIHGQWDQTASVSGASLKYGAQGNNDIVQGDILRFFDKHMNLIDTATVTSAPTGSSFSPPSGSTWQCFSGGTFQYYTVTLDHAVPAQYDYLINDVNASGLNAQVRGNRFLNNRSNAVLIKCEGAIVENNVFDGCSASGVAIFPTVYWNEGGAVINLTVQNNIFRDCGRWGRTNLANAGAVTVGLDGDPGGMTGTTLLRNITIANNTFDNNAGLEITARYASNVSLLNNFFINTHQAHATFGADLGFDQGTEIQLGATNGVNLTGDIVRNQGSYATSLIKTDSTAVNTSGLPGGMALGLNTRLVNANFDNDNPTQTPSGWSTNGPTFDADYTESYGGARRGALHLTHWKTSAYELYTYQTVGSLPNGSYTLRAWVKGSGGQTAAYMEAKDFGNPTLRANIGALSSWTQITIPNIVVTNGQCTVGFYSKAGANQWIMADEVEFY